MSYTNKYGEDNVAANFYLEDFEYAGKTKRSRSSTGKSESVLEKTVCSDLEDDRRETLGFDIKEFTKKYLDDFGLMEQEGLMTVLEKEKFLSLDELNDETNLKERQCQHSKTNREYFDICSLEGKAAYEEADVGNSHLESVAFSKRTGKGMKSAGTSKIGPIHSGKKAKLSVVPRRKHDTKHSTTNEEHFVDHGKSSGLSSFNSSDDTRSGMDVENQNDNDVLFLKLKSIGKLKITNASDTVFDLPNDSRVSLTSSTPENIEHKIIKEDTCQKQYTGNTHSFPTIDNQSKKLSGTNKLHIPELHFDEVADTESSIKANQKNKKNEDKTSKIDERIRLSIPKELHKSEMGRMKVKKRIDGKMESNAITHGGKGEIMYKRELQITQGDKSMLSHWKTQKSSETQVKAKESAKILSKRSKTGEKELRNFKEMARGTRSKEAKEEHLSTLLLDDVDAHRNETMTSPNCHTFPSLSGESISESSFMMNTNESPYESVHTFQEFERQNLAERQDVKKQFRLKIAEAKKKLLEARLTAEEETVAKRLNEALKKHTEIKLKRAFMKADSMSKAATPTLDARRSSSVVAVKKTFKDVSLSVLTAGVSNIQEIRKAEADFDRAKVKQIQTKMKQQKKKNLTKTSTVPQGKKLKSFKKKDKERLERYEVEKMISELRSLNMIDYADKLSQAMACKDEYEAKLRHELNEERKHAAQLARKQKSEELARIRDEEKRKKIAEKERIEKERREREALEIAKRQAEAMKRREHNLKLQESLNYTLLATDTSRSFTYSYLPVLKAPPAQIEENDREKFKKVKARYLEGI